MSPHKEKIGFIGFGKMAEALWSGLADRQILATETTRIAEHTPERRKYARTTCGLEALPVNDLTRWADIVFICVKPQNIGQVLEEIPSGEPQKKYISILAGTPIRTFQTRLGKDIEICRVMPNTPALAGQGASALAFSPACSPAFQTWCLSAFSEIGLAIEVSESQLHAVTGVSGSGPAFLYRIADLMAKAGEAGGLPYDLALKLAAQTLIGAGTMLLKTGQTPEALIQAVASPNGTTVAGLTRFDHSSIDQDFIAVITAAIHRSETLEKET